MSEILSSEAFVQAVDSLSVASSSTHRRLFAHDRALRHQVEVLREALPTYPWGENDECYSCGGGEPEHWDGCNWVTARAALAASGGEASVMEPQSNDCGSEGEATP